MFALSRETGGEMKSTFLVLRQKHSVSRLNFAVSLNPQSVPPFAQPPSAKLGL